MAIDPLAKTEVHGTRTMNGAIVNESPSAAPTPKVTAGGLATIVSALFMLYLRRTGLIASGDEAALWDAFLQAATPAVLGFAAAWATPPAGWFAAKVLHTPMSTAGTVTTGAPGGGGTTGSLRSGAVFFALFLASALSACVAGPNGVPTVAAPGAAGMSDPAYQLVVTCEAWDSVLRSLAGYRAAGKLNAGQVATVDRYRPTLNAACSGETPPTNPAALLDQAEVALQQMIIVKGSVK